MSEQGQNWNIYLAGFMGSGKSTVGSLLARRMGRLCLELDEEIERRRQEMESRDKPWTPLHRDRHVSTALRAYAKMATSADKGAVRQVD